MSEMHLTYSPSVYLIDWLIGRVIKWTADWLIDCIRIKQMSSPLTDLMEN